MTSKYLTQTPNISDFEKKGYLIINATDELLNCINSIFFKASKFYQNDKSIKSINCIPNLNEGWRDLGGEFSITPEQPDLHESFWVTQKQKAKVSSIYSEEGLNLYDNMFNCISIYNDIERTLTKMLMEYYGQDVSVIPGFNCEHDSDMQVLYYQPCIHDRDLLQEPHDDSLYMTFAKATNRGLEILLPDNQFHKAILQKNEILVMPGEILSLMTGYKIKPLIHKVVRHTEQMDRFSLGYFTLPNINEGQKIIPWVSNETNKDIDIMSRVIHNQNQFLVK